MAERLGAQMILEKKREKELALQTQRATSAADANEQTIAQHAKLKKERDAVVALEKNLRTERENVIAELKKIADKDEQMRKELQQEINERVDEINARVERESPLYAEVVDKNIVLKERIKIVLENTQKGETKLNEIEENRARDMAAGNDYAAGLQKKVDELKVINENLKKRAAEVQDTIDEHMPRRNRLMEEAQSYVKGFEELQKKLKETNNFFARNKQESAVMEKNTEKAELAAAAQQQKVKRVQKEKEIEMQNKADLLQKISVTENQTEKLLKLAETLQSS